MSTVTKHEKCIGSSHEGVFSVGQDASCGTVSGSIMMLLGQYWRDFGLDLFRESKGIEVVRRLVELGVTVDSIDRRCNSHASWNWGAVAEPDTILVSDLATSKSRAYLSYPALKKNVWLRHAYNSVCTNQAEAAEPHGLFDRRIDAVKLADGCFAPDPFVRRQHALALLSQTFDNRGRVGQGT